MLRKDSSSHGERRGMMARSIVRDVRKKAEGHSILCLLALQSAYQNPNRDILLILAFCLIQKLPS